MKELTVIGIDLAKNIFQIHGANKEGRQVLSERLQRNNVTNYIAKLPKCLVAMEACGGAHYWARTFQKLGHEVKIISPQFVKPYVKSNKNDYVDAEAIAEAATRPSMRFVPIKQVWHQDIQMLHRIRERLIKERTALTNEIRGFLAERGIVVPKGINYIKKQLPLILEDGDNELSAMGREFFARLLEELRRLEKELEVYEEKIEYTYQNHESCQRLGEIDGVGPITATAILYAVSDPHLFKNGREFSAWLGLVPKQRSSGSKELLLGISKRGDKYLRKLLIHGARAVVNMCENRRDKRSRWIKEKKASRGYNRASVALANKNARIIWALLARGERYRQAA